MKKVASIDDYIASTILEETIKWGMPVYTLKSKNVAGFSAFKSWTGIWFYQGVFLKNSAGILIKAQRKRL